MDGNGDKARQKQAETLAEKMETIRKSDGFVPLVVEFAGSPKSGKSTNIDIVTHFFKRAGFRIWSPTEGASKRTPPQLRKDWFAFNIWALNYAVSEIMFARCDPNPYDLIILDRGPFDSLAWMRLLREDGKLPMEQYDYIEKFVLHPKWMEAIGRVWLFTCSPDKSLERENATKLIKSSEGSVMNPKTLGALLKQYESLRDDKKLLAGKDIIRPIPTDEGKDPRESARIITDDIIALLEQKTSDG